MMLFLFEIIEPLYLNFNHYLFVDFIRGFKLSSKLLMIKNDKLF
jgi:hypothetical protein